MFTDTHFHITYLEDRGVDCAAMFEQLAGEQCPFLLDAGTRCSDLETRMDMVKRYCETLRYRNASAADYIEGIVRYSAGIWPAPEAIRERDTQIAELEHIIRNQLAKDAADGKKRLCAVGECGLDHHWNPAGEDNRSLEDFDKKMIAGEAEMFEMQIDAAKRYKLPVIVHSRDAFEGTLACIKNGAYHNGVIHCYSYGIPEARAFLDLGWYISFSGSVTYAKKSKIEDMRALVRFVPRDRMLLETDAPYLAPGPERGKVNTPLFIKHTYAFISDALCMDTKALCALSAANAKTLFG